MSSSSVRKGSWTQEEDNLLRHCIENYGEGQWHQVPHRAGLNRCRKSCRLRWLNYLRPNIKRGSFGLDEVDLIIRLHKLLGNRWSLIAGRLPGRTANDVKNHWNTRIKKKVSEEEKGTIMEAPAKITTTTTRRRSNSTVIKPRPRAFSKNSPWLIPSVEQQTNSNEDRQVNHSRDDNEDVFVPKSASVSDQDDDMQMQWLENLFNAKEMMSEGSSNLWSEEIWGGANGGGDDNRTQNDFTYFCI